MLSFNILLLFISVGGTSSASLTDGRLDYVGDACEGQILEMKCPVDYVISFISAFYGRNDLDICAANDTAAHHVTNCSAENPLQSLEAKCAGKSFCEFNTTSENIGEDPCPGIQKVLSVEFYCSEYLLTGTQCEGKSIYLECQENEGVEIKEAFYGRDPNDQNTCRSSDVEWLPTNCSSNTALDTLKQLCASKRLCDIYVHPSLLGDPCVETSKYLDVTFVCFPCMNQYGDDFLCDRWASDGECDLNQDWMAAYCRKSCSRCDYGQSCENTFGDNNDCTYWASIGECVANSEWMSKYCAKACNRCPLEKTAITELPSNITTVAPTVVIPDEVTSQTVCEAQTTFMSCQANQGLRIYEAFFGRKDNTTCPHPAIQSDDCPSHWSVTPNVQHICQGRPYCYMSAQIEVFTDPCPGNFKYLEVKYECQECQNSHGDDDCNLWMEQGECELNPFWMAEYCFKACSRCDVSECGNALGNDISCDHWALVNECEVNREWMKYNCQESCRECTEETPRTVTPPSLTPTISPTSDQPEGPITTTACEGQVISLKCPMTHGIIITSAFYGRETLDVCGKGVPSSADLTCSSTTVLDDLRRECGAVSNCYVQVLPSFLGDPCIGLLKYVTVVHECLELAYFTCSVPCGDHGTCIDKNRCLCDKGYSGDKCDTISCEIESNCSGHGECTGPATCTCNDGWSGLDCSIPDCSTTKNCSGQGVCVAPGTCWCYPYFSGDDCKDCSFGFPTGPSCLPCPSCVNGQCNFNDAVSTDSYLGCFRDLPGERDLPLLAWIGVETNTALCLQTCHARGFKFAGLQSGDTCFCGNSYGRHGTSFQCTSECNSGDKGEICGGRLANSIWRVYEGRCDCTGEQWVGDLCDKCAPGFAGPNCTPLTPTTKDPENLTKSISTTTVTKKSTTFKPVTKPPVLSTVGDIVTQTIEISIILTTPWREVYADSHDVNSRDVIEMVLTELETYFTQEKMNYKDFTPTSLSSFSDGREIQLTTTLHLRDEVPDLEAFRLNIFCELSEAFTNGRIVGDSGIDTRITQTEEDLCKSMADYCGEHGTLVSTNPDNSTWVCSCSDKYSGRQCDYSEWDATKAIVIVVVCTVGPILTIAVLCFALRHKRFMKLPFRNSSDADTSFKYQDMNRARKNTNRKLFQMQERDEDADGDGFTPRRI